MRPAPSRAVVAAAAGATLALLGAAPRAEARKFSGSASGGTNPFIGRFSFGVDASGSPVGSATMTYSYASGVVR